MNFGRYLIECWGASGGDEKNAKGASGAYVSGVLTIYNHIDFYVYVGKKGANGKSFSFNVGGRGSTTGSSGGGATDIRLVDDEGIEGLKSRIIVASGGGGASNHSKGCTGGSGGILKGEDGYKTGPGSDVVASTGATQISGGERGYPVASNPSFNGTNGYLGNGGNSAANENYGSGAGGGYFDGGGGADSQYSTSSGAGGSSYISGFHGCKAISNSTTSIWNPIMLDHPNHYSGLIFKRIKVKEGKYLQRHDDGHVTITLLNSEDCSFNKNSRRNDICLVSLVIMTIAIK